MRMRKAFVFAAGLSVCGAGLAHASVGDGYPDSGKAIGLTKAIQVLKPSADAKAEGKSAERRAHEDIKDASS